MRSCRCTLLPRALPRLRTLQTCIPPAQVPRKLIGSDAFQETPIVEVTRQVMLCQLVKALDSRLIGWLVGWCQRGLPGDSIVEVTRQVGRQS